MNKGSIAISFCLLFYFLGGCKNESLRTNRKTDMQETFEKFITASCKIDSPTLVVNKKQPIIVDFFIIDNIPSIRVVDFPGVSLKKLKGYCEYNNSIILYYGVNDSLANKYLMLSTLDIAKLEREYYILDNIDIEIDLKDSSVRFYTIKNDTIFNKLKPTEVYMSQVESLLIDSGILSLPPPIPKEDD